MPMNVSQVLSQRWCVFQSWPIATLSITSNGLESNLAAVQVCVRSTIGARAPPHFQTWIAFDEPEQLVINTWLFCRIWALNVLLLLGGNNFVAFGHRYFCRIRAKIILLHFWNCAPFKLHPATGKLLEFTPNTWKWISSMKLSKLSGKSICSLQFWFFAIHIFFSVIGKLWPLSGKSNLTLFHTPSTLSPAYSHPMLANPLFGLDLICSPICLSFCLIGKFSPPRIPQKWILTSDIHSLPCIHWPPRSLLPPGSLQEWIPLGIHCKTRGGRPASVKQEYLKIFPYYGVFLQLNIWNCITICNLQDV